jgi:hypothetical protein
MITKYSRLRKIAVEKIHDFRIKMEREVIDFLNWGRFRGLFRGSLKQLSWGGTGKPELPDHEAIIQFLQILIACAQPHSEIRDRELEALPFNYREYISDYALNRVLTPENIAQEFKRNPIFNKFLGNLLKIAGVYEDTIDETINAHPIQYWLQHIVGELQENYEHDDWKYKERPFEDEVEENRELILEDKFYPMNGESEILYEDTKWLVVQPKTYPAYLFYITGTYITPHTEGVFERYWESFFIFLLKDEKVPMYLWDSSSTEYEEELIDQDENPERPVDFFKSNPELSDFFKNKFFSQNTLEKILQGKPAVSAASPSLQEIVEDSRDYRIDRVESWLSDGFMYDFDSGYSWKDILNELSLSEENKQLIVNYLQEKYADYFQETGLTLEDFETIADAIEELDEDYEITTKISSAYDDAVIGNIISTTQRYLNNYLSQHFGLDFSKWYVGEDLLIPAEYIVKNWSAFMGESPISLQKNIADILIKIAGKLDSSDFNRAVELGYNSGYAEEDTFNDYLYERLREL